MLRSFEQRDVSLTLYRGDPWFRASDVTDILGYRRSALAVRAHVGEKHVCTLAELGLESNAAKQSIGSGGKSPLYVSEAGVYELMWHSKKPEALRFRQWLVEEVLPEIRRTNGYVRNQQVSLMCETDLHYKVVHFLRRFFAEAVMVPGLGELQDTSEKRIDSWSKGYIAGQPDLILLNRTRKHSGLAIELKTPMCQRSPSPQQHTYLQSLQDSGFQTLVSNCYDEIVVKILEFRADVRRCKPRKVQAPRV